MTNIKIIFIDIDGTLIKDNKSISVLTKSVLQKIINEMHIKVVLISSRMPNSLVRISNELNIPANYIALNGSIINLDLLTLDEKHVLKKNILSQKIIEESCLSVTNWDDTSVNLFTNSKWITNNKGYWTKREIKSTFIEPDYTDLTPQNLLLKIESFDIRKILIRSNKNTLDTVYSNLKNNKIKQKALMIRTKPTLIEITPFGVNKGEAIERICSLLNFKKDNLIAFGDGENDLEMIKFVKYGYAMGNSSEVLKRAAIEVIDDNNNDGVANKLISLFKLKL